MGSTLCIPKQVIHYNENYDGTKATATPFPSGVARYQCSKESSHKIVLKEWM